jgi:hypothetical protein
VEQEKKEDWDGVEYYVRSWIAEMLEKVVGAVVLVVLEAWYGRKEDQKEGEGNEGIF